MEWHQKFFEIIFRWIRRQNEWLIHEISVREGIDERELRKLLPSCSEFRNFLNHPMHKAPASDRALPHPCDEYFQGNDGSLVSGNP